MEYLLEGVIQLPVNEKSDFAVFNHRHCLELVILNTQQLIPD